MKISEMNNEQATEALVRIAAPISNICDDEDFVALLKGYSDREDGLTNIQVWGRLVPQIVTVAFKKHKADLYEVVGALAMKTPSQVAKMNFLETINVIRESYDDVLNGFFTHSGKQTKERETE